MKYKDDLLLLLSLAIHTSVVALVCGGFFAWMWTVVDPEGHLADGLVDPRWHAASSFARPSGALSCEDGERSSAGIGDERQDGPVAPNELNVALRPLTHAADQDHC